MNLMIRVYRTFELFILLDIVRKTLNQYFARSCLLHRVNIYLIGFSQSEFMTQRYH